MPESILHRAAELWRKQIGHSIYLLPKCSNRALKLARQSTLGPIACFYPELVKPPRASTAFCSLIPTSFSSNALPEAESYRVARQLSIQVLEKADDLLPGIFQWGGLDFRAALRVTLQISLSYQILPLFYSVLAKLDSGQKNSLTLIDSPITSEMLQELAESSEHAVSVKSYCVRSTMSGVRLRRKISQWEESSTRESSLPAVTGGTLAVLPHLEHLGIIQPALEILADQAPVQILLPNKKIPISSDLESRLSKQAPLQIHSLPDIPAGPRLLESIQHFQALDRRIQQLTSVDDRHFCYNLLDRLLDLAEKLMIFESALKRAQPEIIVGCLEFNVYGLLSSMLKQVMDFRFVNLQHGLITPMHTLDGFRCDEYLLWNDSTRNLVIEEGFPEPNALKVVGNPKWEALEDEVANPLTFQTLDDLWVWKGSSRLIGAYTQVIQGCSTISVKQQYLASLFDYLRHHSETRLLIKKHPLESDPTVDEMVATATDLGDRIRVYQPGTLGLGQSLAAIDVVTSVFSATLLESVYLRKPTLALDFERILESVRVDFHSAAIVITDPQEVTTALNHLFQQIEVEHGAMRNLGPDATQALTPRFDQPYRKRLRQILIKSRAKVYS